jgi:hypothetical protein
MGLSPGNMGLLARVGVVVMSSATALRRKKRSRRWLYTAVYLLFTFISFLPLYTQQPYAPEETQDVIISLQRVSITPYQQFAPFFHVATLLLVVLIALYAEKTGRILAAYMGLNYLVIAFAQSIGTTPRYGLVIHTGALITSVLLGVVWLIVAARGNLKPTFKKASPRRFLLLPLAILAFWGPYNPALQPDFNPILLLTSPDYGLTFCFTTPVFLFLLILIYPQVDHFAYKITAFNGLLYGLFNLTHFFSAELKWIGVLHLPLLIISVTALWLAFRANMDIVGDFSTLPD